MNPNLKSKQPGSRMNESDPTPEVDADLTATEEFPNSIDLDREIPDLDQRNKERDLPTRAVGIKASGSDGSE